MKLKQLPVIKKIQYPKPNRQISPAKHASAENSKETKQAIDLSSVDIHLRRTSLFSPIHSPIKNKSKKFKAPARELDNVWDEFVGQSKRRNALNPLVVKIRTLPIF